MPDTPTDPVEAATKAAWDALADDETDVHFVDPDLGTIDGHFDLRAVMSAAIRAYREALEASGDPWTVIRALAANEPQCDTRDGDVTCALCVAALSFDEPHESTCPYQMARNLVAAPTPEDRD